MLQRALAGFHPSDGFLRFRRAAAPAVLSLRLQPPEVLGTAFCDFLPSLPSKSDGGGILLSCHRWKNNLLWYYALRLSQV